MPILRWVFSWPPNNRDSTNAEYFAHGATWGFIAIFIALALHFAIAH